MVKFKHGTRRRALEYEKDWVQRWKKDRTFEKSVENRSVDNQYVFYDGPPFITGVPHHGTLLGSIVKDVIPRYQTMKGKRVERVWGWDCHGLPAEVYTEKKLGIKDRRDIGTKISLETYIKAARENMVQTSSLWNDTIDRIGRWVDMDNAYKTMDKEYMESIWWAFKELYKKGKIYEGERVLMYCVRDATPLSKAEVTMDSGTYKEVTDPSVYVKFKLEGEENTYLLAWTTTPWTLPANTALAVNNDLIYTKVKIGDEYLIIARDLLEKVLVDDKKQPIEYDFITEFDGSDLVGKSYHPVIPNVDTETSHKIWHGAYVSTESGTGIVHTAPAYGEEDFTLSQENKIPVVHVLDESGFYTSGKWEGQNIWDVNKIIAKDLHASGDVWKIDYYRHTYPHCHRCDTKLIYRAHPSWFFDVQGQKYLMLDKNSEQINWFPDHLKEGRFRKNIEQAPDWNLSRDRFWATAMPVWEGVDSDGEKHRIVVGSYAELKELSGVELEDYHRPWVDDIEFDKDGVHYKRIDKVLDGWFESGSMPFAQFHYPFENKEKFEANFPGDFIVEYIGQVRAWFYYMHVVSMGLFGESSFKNVITTGVVAGNDGRKMSKSYNNFTDPNELMDKFSADSLRFLLLSSPLLNGEDFALHDKDVGDVARKISMIWNMYDFFTMYAEVDGWEYAKYPENILNELENPLDIWIVSRLHQLIEIVEKNMDEYNIPDAMNPILPFLDDASNWFVRRSRRRFWKSEDDGDKDSAYKTLHYVLLRLSYLMAPFTPFLAEELYHNLTGDNESIHLKDWIGAGDVDYQMIEDMSELRRYINEALAIRAKNGIKIRQPLSSVKIPKPESDDFGWWNDILTEELNVKSVIWGQDSVDFDFEMTEDLIDEGSMREIVRHIQAARKKAGLNVDDRIILNISTESEALGRALNKFMTQIKNETLTESLSDKKLEFTSTAKVNNEEIVISLEKA